ncbi:hypothetical protein GCM10025865_16070 [Paraoerskovia sediminicola]|uniref:DUF475 domain-containing protein n=2 Tax=Paraoerskovia sediminicola TaxID=1138587 RepID=A0ABN6XFR0_9CELL|nr:hypothetical protein GCM10025865_16070 [Paraoerskovia sediminicola]
MFLTVGILIAVFGMRLIFPFVIVSVTGGISPGEALTLALEKGDPTEPGTYGYILNEAHPTIAAFGGIFLLMLFLDFLFDAERGITWLTWVERPLQKAARLGSLSVLVAGLVLMAAGQVLAEPADRGRVLFAGLAGLVVYLAVKGLSTVMESKEAERAEVLEREAGERGSSGPLQLAGRAAFSMFMFLEVLDATFSFDGVIGAFAITPDPLIIALGLGVGALFVRSMTIFLVRRGTLGEYRYLEHGAHWAIGTLAVLLLLTLRFDIPDIVIGLAGLAFIVTAWVGSAGANRRDAAASPVSGG